MANKLTNEEKLNSLSAAHHFLQNNGGNIKINAMVLAEKNGDIIFKSKVNIMVGDYQIYYQVSISWEEGLEENEDYHQLGLFGYYSTNYCEMKYSRGTLVIQSDKNVKITIIS